MLKLLIVRHGETDWNASGRMQGQSDVPLNEKGLQQAEAIARRLKGEPFDVAYTSDLQRARATAEAILAFHEVPLALDVRLREIHFGEWSGKTYFELQKEQPEAVKAWEADMERYRPPGGESKAQLAERVNQFRLHLLERHQDQTVLLAAHGGPLQVLICQLVGISHSHYWQFPLSNASLTRVSAYPEGAVINLLNDVGHLDHLV